MLAVRRYGSLEGLVLGPGLAPLRMDGGTSIADAFAAMNEDAYCEVYNDSTIKKIKSYFPIKIHTQMSGFGGTARDKFGQISVLVDKLHKDSRGLLADLDGEEVLDNDYEGTFSDDEEESTDDDEDDVSGDMRSHNITNQDVLNLLGVSCFKELEADDVTKEGVDDNKDEAEEEIYVNISRCLPSYFPAVARPSVFVSDVREEPPGEISDERYDVGVLRPGPSDHELGDPRALCHRVLLAPALRC